MTGVTAGTILRWLVRLPALVVVGVLRLYQLLVSPLLGPTCRFYPSCSSYAVQALTTHGLLRGSWLTVRRLARCHPWNPGGVDLVPGVGPSPAAHGTDPSDGHAHEAASATPDGSPATPARAA